MSECLNDDGGNCIAWPDIREEYSFDMTDRDILPSESQYVVKPSAPYNLYNVVLLGGM